MSLKLVLTAALASMAAARPQTRDVPEDSIVGGEAAEAGEFPYIVSLSRSGSHFCGGTLINANTVLTAAHCSEGQTASSVRVRAGSLNRSSGGTQVGVSTITIHPDWDSDTLDNDVALWTLSTSIPTSSTIGYATLAQAGSDPVADSIATVAGWGTLSSGGSTLPTLLQKVSVPIVSRTECRSSYGTSAITNNMICAGLDAGGKDSCQGDSGGPLVSETTGELIGVVSWGQGCAEAEYPGVYARVSTLLDFIEG